MTTVKNLSIQDVADEIGINSKTIRKVLRANVPAENQPGRGGRWIIKSTEIEIIRKMVESHTAKTHSVADLSAFAD